MLEIVEGHDRSWTIAGFGIRVPDLQPAAQYVLSHAAMLVAGPGPWPIRLHMEGTVFELVLGADGGVTLDPRSASTPTVWGWLFPAGRFSEHLAPPTAPLVASAPPVVQPVVMDNGFGPAEACPYPGWHRATEGGKYCTGCGKQRPAGEGPEGVLFVSAHHSAGTTTWATLLGGADMRQQMPLTGQVVGVCRATPGGINAMKKLIGEHGVERFRSVLVVADAPGRMLPQAAREVKSLAGGVPVVVVPWISKLRGVDAPASAAALIARPVARVRNELERAARVVPREFRHNHNRRNG
ncbi:hypothetical protein [Agromyces neolithicus]|uniref:hypothetical protein n=1 Tax=Agromyces neolithicus TaxID=269420 RepID=UPI0031E3CB88